jgi:hypothetical protein
VVHEGADCRHRGYGVIDSPQCLRHLDTELRIRLRSRQSSEIEQCLSHLLEDPEVSEQPPENDEDDDRTEAAAAQLLRAISCRDAAQTTTTSSSPRVSVTMNRLRPLIFFPAS